MKLIISLLFLLAISASAANLPDFPFVVAKGQSEVKVKPDMATIHVSILAFDKSSETALQLNNIAFDKILAITKENDIDIKSIKTGDIEKSTTINRDKNYNSLGVLGYEVSRRITIKLDNLGNYPVLIGEIVKIDNLSRIQTNFDVKDRKSVENQLIIEAGKQARESAELSAKALGVKIISVYAISDVSDFGEFFATFGAHSYAVQSMYMDSNGGQLVMFVPESINLNKSINVVFKIK